MKTTMMLLLVVMLVVCFGFNAEAATWTVKRGNTLNSIAKQTGISVKEIARINKLKNIHRIRIGQVLTIPEKASAKAAPVQTEKVAKAEIIRPVVDNQVQQSVITQEVRVQTLTSTATLQATSASSENYTLQPVKKVAVREQSSTEQETQALLKKLADQSQETTANLEKAREQKLTASTEEPYNVPFMGTTRTDKEAGLHKFFEFDATIGGWASDKSTRGVYGFLEGLQWFGNESGDANYGVGATLALDKGWGENGAKWGFFAPGLELGYWKNIDDNIFFLIKPRVGYRINEDNPWNDKPKSGLTAGVYTDLSKVFTPRDLGIIAFDATYYENDSHGALRAYWEHMLNNDWKVKVGAGPSGHFQKDEKFYGVSPVLSVKYKDTISVGVVGDFNRVANTVGLNIMYEFNSDRHNGLALQKK